MAVNKKIKHGALNYLPFIIYFVEKHWISQNCNYTGLLIVWFKINSLIN